MTNSHTSKTGLGALLTPDNCALMFIDHQPFQISGVKNIEVSEMLNNAVLLAKAAKAFDVPTLLTTVVKDRGGIDAQANDRVRDLAEKLGFAPVILGALAQGGLLQQFGGPFVGINLVRHSGPAR